MCPNKSASAFLPLARLLAALIVLTCTAAFAADPPGISINVIVPESLTSIQSGMPAMSGERRESMMAAQSTTGKKISLVGEVEGAKKVEIVIINNGRQAATPVFYENFFHAQIILSLGVNMIDVRWRKGEGAWNVKSLSIFRSSKLEGGVTSSYPPYTFHEPKNEELCQQCHQMGLTKIEIDTGMQKSCLKCHKSLNENVYVHGPMSVGICTVCHDPDSTPNKYKISDNDDIQCYGCHEDRRKIDKSKKLLHGPVGAGMCAICHDPHSSPFPFQLVKAKNEVCLMCHQEDADRWLGQNSLHPPFKNGECSGCHDPHSSDFKYNLKASRAELCKLCHELPIPGHLHETGRAPLFKMPDDMPLDENGKTMCITCHDPHGAKGDKLTRREGCDGCHPK
ncbi:MAG TPA: cytochrome c3 family protein [Nitrospirota bacterium]